MNRGNSSSSVDTAAPLTPVDPRSLSIRYVDQCACIERGAARIVVAAPAKSPFENCVIVPGLRDVYCAASNNLALINFAAIWETSSRRRPVIRARARAPADHLALAEERPIELIG